MNSHLHRAVKVGVEWGSAGAQCVCMHEAVHVSFDIQSVALGVLGGPVCGFDRWHAWGHRPLVRSSALGSPNRALRCLLGVHTQHTVPTD